LAEIVHEAFYIARTGRPGPVLIDIPKDVTAQKTAFYYPARFRKADTVPAPATLKFPQR